MPDDEPLDDARAVGTAAAAAAARVTETVARHVADTKARERAALERAHDQQVARQAIGTVEQHRQPNLESKPRLGVKQTYDSTEQRGRRDAGREEAGVPPESRRVIATADQMNGQDPTLAASVGKTQTTRTRAAAPSPDRPRGR